MLSNHLDVEARLYRERYQQQNHMNFNGIELADKKDKGYDTELVNRTLNVIYLCLMFLLLVMPRSVRLMQFNLSAVKRHLPNLNDDGKDGLSQKIIKFIKFSLGCE